MPRYIGLKDFVNGCQKLLKVHGNIPVFIEADTGKVAPVGNAITMNSLLGGEAIVFVGGYSDSPEKFKKGECTS